METPHPAMHCFVFVAVPRVLLVAISVVANATPQLAGAHISPRCIDLTERLDRLHVEIERLHAETALVEAELGALCAPRTRQTEVQVAPVPALPRQSTTAGSHAADTQRTAQSNAEHPARRSGNNRLAYSVQCWNHSAHADPACNCTGNATHPEFGSRRAIKIVVGSWYASGLAC
jgi:hypothetical protein